MQRRDQIAGLETTNKPRVWVSWTPAALDIMNTPRVWISWTHPGSG